VVSLGSKEGAIRGLIGVGKEAVYRGLIGGKAGKVLGEEAERRIRSKTSGNGAGDTLAKLNGFDEMVGFGSEDTWEEEVRDVVDAFMVGLETVHPLPSTPTNPSFPSFAPHSHYVDPGQLHEAKLQLSNLIGPFFAELVCRKSREWAISLASALLERENRAEDSTPLPNGVLAARSRTISDDRSMNKMVENGALANSGSPDDVFGTADDSLMMPVHLGMGLPVGMGGDLGGLGSDVMDAT